MAENLSLLNKTFVCDEILSSEDLNLLVAFINNIINHINDTVNTFINNGGTPGLDGKDGRDGRDGTNGKNGNDGNTPYIVKVGDDYYWYIDGVNTGVLASHVSGINYKEEFDALIIQLKHKLLELENSIKNLGGEQGSSSSYDINEIISLVLDALNGWDWNEIIHFSNWDPDLQLYLTSIGLVTQQDWDANGKLITLSISEIILKLNAVEILVQDMSIGTDGEGNQVSIEQLKASIIAQIASEYALSKMSSAINQWPETMEIGGETISNPTIYSALSYTKNLAEKTDAGLLASFLEYAGVISLNNYTLSLIEGISNTERAKLTSSTSFGEYLTDSNGYPIYETYGGTENTNGYPEYESDEFGRAIPYTGIVLKYIRYEDLEGNLVNEPVEGGNTLIVSDPNLASNVVRKEARLDLNGNVIKVDGVILYNTVLVYDNSNPPKPLKKLRAFMVYYRPTNISKNGSAANPTDFANGLYGEFKGHEYYLFEDEDFGAPDTLANFISNENDTDPYFMYGLERYSSSDVSTLTSTYGGEAVIKSRYPYIAVGEIKWDFDSNYDNRANRLRFIKNYGPNKIAYRKKRKLKVKNTSGIITEANADLAFASLFSNTESSLYSAIATMTSRNSAFVTAVAQAALNLTETATATAKMIADGSVYLARNLYKYDTGSTDSNGDPVYTWKDIATEEEVFLIGVNSNQFNIEYDTPSQVPNVAVKDSNDNPITRIKPGIGEGEIEWVQDTAYLYDNKLHSFEEFRNDLSLGVLNSGNISEVNRVNLWVRTIDGVVIKEGDEDPNHSGYTYVEEPTSGTHTLLSNVATKKKKLLIEATSGIINTIDLSEDYSLSNLFAKIENTFDSRYSSKAEIATVVHRKVIKDSNNKDVYVLASKIEDNTTYYLYRNKSENFIDISIDESYASGEHFWSIDNWETFKTNHPDLLYDVEPIYELESSITLSADLINFIGNTVFEKITADQAFINNLVVKKLNTSATYSNYYDSILYSTVTSNIFINSNDGIRQVDSTTYASTGNTESSDINWIKSNGEGFLAKGNISWDKSNIENKFKVTITGELCIKETGVVNNVSTIFRMDFDPTDGLILSIIPVNGNKININKFGIDGSGYLAKGNISWNSSGDTTFRGVIEAIKTTTKDTDLIYTNYDKTRYETIIKPDKGFYQAIGHRNDNDVNEGYTYEGIGTNYINAFNIDGSGHLARKNISWDVNGNTTFKGIIYNSDVESLSPAIRIDGIDYHYMLNENVMDPDIGFYLAVAYKETSSDSWEYFGGEDYSGTKRDYTNLISMDGSGFLAKGNICWDKDGNTTFKGTVNGTIKVSSFYQQYLNLSGSSDGDSLGVINLDISKGTYIIAQVADSNYYYSDNLGLCASKIIIPDPNNAPNVTLTIVAPTVDLLHNTWIYPVIRAASGTFFYTKKDYSGTNSGYYRLLSFMLVPNLVVKLHSIGGGWYLDTDEDYITSYSTSTSS